MIYGLNLPERQELEQIVERPGIPSLEFSTTVARDPRLRPYAKLVAFLLYSLTFGGRDTISISAAEIAQSVTGPKGPSSEVSIRQCLRALREAEYITVDNDGCGRGIPARYTLNPLPQAA